jgi:hypothetical protein
MMEMTMGRILPKDDGGPKKMPRDISRDAKKIKFLRC